MKGGDGERRSDFSVRLFLKEFCVEFLNGAYNTLMYHVKDGLVRAKAQANDESYYMWALKFFMEFNRNYKFQVKLVSETMSVQAFHFIQTQLENCYDMLTSDKKKLLLWSRRMHLALRAYQELLMTLMAMDRSEDPNVRESSKVIKSNIFYVVEYRELILTLTLNFDEIKFSNSQKSNPKPQASAPTRNPEEIWDEEISQQLSTVLQGEVEIPNVVPFDATSERDIDEQRADAMIRIQTYLREFKFEEAIGLLRAAR
ncbi:Protein timeless [Blattella germanica]|nr:Protein timeless [Blattella germanica]